MATEEDKNMINVVKLISDNIRSIGVKSFSINSEVLWTDDGYDEIYIKVMVSSSEAWRGVVGDVCLCSIRVFCEGTNGGGYVFREFDGYDRPTMFTFQSKNYGNEYFGQIKIMIGDYNE